MHRLHGPLPDIFVIICLLCWLFYSVSVIIYLNYLTRKYLFSEEREGLIGDKKLKTHQQLIEQYKDVDEINILILTGGGIRGVIPLEILSYIEEKTGKKTGELFDFMAGSSTGAISVATFAVGDGNGGYKFSAKYLLDHYYQHLRRIFSSPWYHQFLTMFGLFAPRFLPDNKIKVLEEYFGDSTISELQGNIIIPVYNIDKNRLQTTKNWNPPHGELNANYLVKDLINGASNPPMLFPPVAFSINEVEHLFIDPAVILNNPILHVMLHVRMLFPDKKLNMVLISNGGMGAVKYDYRSMFGFGLYGIYQYLLSAPSLSSRLYVDFLEDYLRDAKKFYDKIDYFKIASAPPRVFSPTDTSQTNIDEIGEFSKNMLNENLVVIHQVIDILTRKSVKKSLEKSVEKSVEKSGVLS